jgi:hypothetical protein
MARRDPARLVSSVLLLAAAVLACALPGQSADVDTLVQQTINARDTAAAAGSGGEIVPPGDTPVPPAASEAPTEPPPPTPTVVHVLRPANPAAVQSFMTDVSSASTAGERRSTGDNFDTNRMERPFTASVMDYQPWLDITRGELSVDSTWTYIVIFLEDPPPADAQAAYAVEIDLNLDGRGDWLIAGLLPPSSDWTTDGVRILRDSNADVGGAHPIQADPPPQSGNGFDTLVFDQGQGTDPDAAWIRRSPSASDQVQIAFKTSLIGNDDELLWGVWADAASTQPGWFDYNDHFTPAEAGSPVGGSSLYPVQSLASIDNTCRWVYDFTPVEELPGMCFLPPTPTPIVPGSINGIVWNDRNFNNSFEGTDGRFMGWTVTLRSGGCGGSVLGTTVTDRFGYYEFENVPPGTHCVTVTPSAGCGSCSGICPVASSPNPRSVTVPSGGAVTGVNFGFYIVGPC